MDQWKSPKISIIYTKFKECSLPNYLLISGGKIDGSIAFPKVLALFEM